MTDYRPEIEDEPQSLRVGNKTDAVKPPQEPERLFPIIEDMDNDDPERFVTGIEEEDLTDLSDPVDNYTDKNGPVEMTVSEFEVMREIMAVRIASIEKAILFHSYKDNAATPESVVTTAMLFQEFITNGLYES